MYDKVPLGLGRSVSHMVRFSHHSENTTVFKADCDRLATSAVNPRASIKKSIMAKKTTKEIQWNHKKKYSKEGRTREK